MYIGRDWGRMEIVQWRHLFSAHICTFDVSGLVWTLDSRYRKPLAKAQLSPEKHVGSQLVITENQFSQGTHVINGGLVSKWMPNKVLSPKLPSIKTTLLFTKSIADKYYITLIYLSAIVWGFFEEASSFPRFMLLSFLQSCQIFITVR